MSRRIEFFYGIGSRYSYLAAGRLEQLASTHDAAVEWRPINSVRLLRERGYSPFAQSEHLRGQYSQDYRETDARRWAELYGVPFREVRGRLALDPELLARAATVGVLLGKGPELTHALFAAVFHGEVAEVDERECARRAASVGLPIPDFETSLRSEAGAALEQTMQRAHAAGVFGVPTFILNGEQFWGNDRLPLLEHALRRAQR